MSEALQVSWEPDEFLDSTRAASGRDRPAGG